MANSLVYDYCIRNSIGGNNLVFFIIKQSPGLPPSAFKLTYPWCSTESLSTWIELRVRELVETAYDTAAPGTTPFKWDALRRQQIRAELDAVFFHLYGMRRSEVEHILDSFATLCKYEVEESGDFETKRLVLQVFDEMDACKAAGTVFRSKLDPSPGADAARHIEA